MNFQIRELELKDFDSGLLQTLNNLSPCLPIDSEKRSEWYRLVNNRSSNFAYVAVYDGMVIGTAFAVIIPHLARGGKLSMQIEDLATHKEFQGQGVGTALIQKLIELARELGCYKVILDCKKELEEFYKKSGFTSHGLSMRLDI